MSILLTHYHLSNVRKQRADLHNQPGIGSLASQVAFSTVNMFNAVVFQDLSRIVPKGKDNAFWKRLERKKKEQTKKLKEDPCFSWSVLF